MADAPRLYASRGQLTYDFRDFGGKPGTNCTAALQAANDAAKASGKAVTLRVEASPDRHLINAPVWLDCPEFRIQGEGDGSQFFLNAPLILGVPRGMPVDSGGGAFPESAFLQDCSGLGDGTWNVLGYNLGGLHKIALPASPFELGPGTAGTTTPNAYRGVKALTLNFWFRRNGSTWGDITLCGACTATGARASGPMLSISGSNLILDFTTDDGLARQVKVGISQSAPELKGAFQLNIPAGTAGAFLAGLQANADLTRLNAGWGPGASFGLAENRNGEFSVGGGMDSGGTAYPTTYGNFTVVGLSLAAESTYALNGTGTSQTRADTGTAPTDAYRFGMTNTKVFASLSGGVRGLGRSVPWRGTGTGVNLSGWGTALTSTFAPGDTRNNNALRDLRLEAGPAVDSLRVGAVYKLRIDRCTLSGGRRGYSSLKGPTSYRTRITDCVFQYNTDAAVWANFTALRLRGCELLYAGRDVVRTELSGLRAVDCEIAGGGDTRRVFTAIRGQGVFLEDNDFDFEGGATIQEVPILVTADPALANVACNVYLGDTGGSLVKAGSPYARFTTEGAIPQARPAGGYVHVERCFDAYYSVTGPGTFQVDSPFWKGEVHGLDGSAAAGLPLCANSASPYGAALIGYNAPLAHAPLAAPPGFPGLAALGTPVAWFRAADLALSDGAAVTSWPNAADAARPGTAAGGPTFVAGARPAVRFSSTSRFTVPSAALSSDAMTIIAVLKPTSMNRVWDDQGLAGRAFLGGGASLSSLSQSVTLPARAGLPVVLSARYGAYSGGVRKVEGWVNLTPMGTMATTVNSPLSAGQAWTVGGQSAGQSFAGDLYEIIVYDGALGDGNLSSLQRYDSATYGIAM